MQLLLSRLRELQLSGKDMSKVWMPLKLLHLQIRGRMRPFMSVRRRQLDVLYGLLRRLRAWLLSVL